MRKLKIGRYGLLEDPVGLQVAMRYGARDLLGDVRGAYRSEVTGTTHLVVRHFNGEEWPIDPLAVIVDVLVRDYANEGE